MSEFSHFINGEWLTNKGKDFFSYNPASQQVLWSGKEAGLTEVDNAVKSAQAAKKNWAALSIEQRFEYIERFKSILQTKTAEFKILISEETGKPLWEAHHEVGAMIHKIAISKAAYQERCLEKTQSQKDGHAILRHRPHGVLAILGPFNFPGHLPNGHIVPALLAGNTLVFKPSDYTPRVAEAMVRAWNEALLPAGVLNLLQGGAATGKALAQHPGIDGLLFTGSVAAGLALHQSFALMPQKILALEMGGNNPLIVDNPSDLKAAVYQAIQSAYLTSGQRCTCARRLIVLDSPIGRDFVKLLVETAANIQVGSFSDQPEPFMGPVISSSAANKIEAAYNKLIRDGAIPLLPLMRKDPDSAFISPCILDVSQLQNKADQEIFGPVLQLVWVQDFAQALTEANNTAFGLAAGLFSDNIQHYQQFLEEIRAGIVNWNRPLTGASSSAPFGGVGKSGNHRPSAYYAADYCAYPVASLESSILQIPDELSPGLPSF